MKTLFFYNTFLVFLFLVSCTQSAYLGNNDFYKETGRIKVSIISKGHPDSLTFTGEFQDIETGKIPTSSFIRIDSNGYLINQDGIYKVRLKYKEDFVLSAIALGYLPLTTNEIKVKRGNRYQLDFYMKQDTIPLKD